MSDFEKLLDVSRKTIHIYLTEMKNNGILALVGNPKISRGKQKAYWALTDAERKK